MTTDIEATDRWTCVPTLGQTIRAWREARGVTQVELAAAINRTQHYLSDVEKGRVKEPHVSVLIAIASYLEHPVEELFAFVGLEGVAPGGVAVTFYGSVPADTVRWVHAAEEGRVRRVPADWLGSRPPSEFLVVQVSGECLAARQIHTGQYVLVHRLIDRMPKDGQITLVRLGSEFTLKVFHATAEGFELLDGNGAVVYRLHPGDEPELVGTYVAHWGIVDV